MTIGMIRETFGHSTEAPGYGQGTCDGVGAGGGTVCGSQP